MRERERERRERVKTNAEKSRPVFVTLRRIIISFDEAHLGFFFFFFLY